MLPNGLSNRFDNRVNVYIHDTTGCQTRCQTGCQKVTKNRHLGTGCQCGLTTGCIVYTNIQPVVNPIVGCLFTRYSRLSLRLYRVNGVLRTPAVSTSAYRSPVSTGRAGKKDCTTMLFLSNTAREHGCHFKHPCTRVVCIPILNSNCFTAIIQVNLC